MADQFEKQNSKENERKTERRHREFLGVIDKLQEGIVGLDNRFSQLGAGSDMDPEAKKVFEQIDRKTLKSIKLDEKFAKNFSASTLKQLDVLGSMKQFEKKSSQSLVSINRSAGANLGHLNRIGEQFKNIFGILPGRGARIRTNKAENAQIDQRNTLRSIRDINKRSLLTLLRLHDINKKSGMSVLEEKKEDRRAREKSEKNLLDALGLLGAPKDAEKKAGMPFLGLLAAGAGLAFLGKMLKGTKFEATFKSITDFIRLFGIIGNGMILLKNPLNAIMKSKLWKSMGQSFRVLKFIGERALAPLIGAGFTKALSNMPKTSLVLSAFMTKTLPRITGLFSSIGKGFSNFGRIVRIILKGKGGMLGNLMGGKAGGLLKLFGRVGKFIGFFTKLVPSLGPILKMGKVLLKSVGKFFLPITILFGIYDAITGFMKGMEGGGSIFDGVHGALNGILEGLLSPFAMILDWLGEYLGIGPIGTQLLEPIMTIAGGIFTALIAPFKTILEFAKSMFAGDFSEAFRGLFENIFDWFTAIPKALLNAVGGIFGYGDLGNDVIGGFKSIFMGIFGPIGDAIGGAVRWVTDMFKSEEEKAMAEKIRRMEKDNTYKAKKFNRFIQHIDESQGEAFLGERMVASSLSFMTEEMKHRNALLKRSGHNVSEQGLVTAEQRQIERREKYDRMVAEGQGIGLDILDGTRNTGRKRTFEQYEQYRAEQTGFGSAAELKVYEKRVEKDLLIKRENFISKFGMTPEEASEEMGKRYFQLREQFDIDLAAGKHGNLEGVSSALVGKKGGFSFTGRNQAALDVLDLGGQDKADIHADVQNRVADMGSTDWRLRNFDATQENIELLAEGATEDIVAAIEQTVIEDGLATAENIVNSALDAVPDMVSSAVGSFVEASETVKGTLIKAINAFRDDRQLKALVRVAANDKDMGRQTPTVSVAPTQANPSGASQDAATGQSDRG